ncbi:MAG: lasso RiPP family leader peptide-containing protein [Nitrospirota bacterium]
MVQETDADPETTQSKKPYTTPTLVEYGDIAKLTQGNPTGMFADGVSGMFMATSCL